ncbi:MAG: hypothetical protein LBR48_08595 [Dysgonamonadaceae bacterium]|jgi:hypothetical protein|nr:hypothetical protein [Dysgonamonadaceae bacterium]
MRKKIIHSAIAIMLLVANGVGAQDDFKRHELEGGLGIWNTSQIVFTLSDALSNSLGIGGMNVNNLSGSPAFHVGYKYWLTERFGVGATLAMGSESGNVFNLEKQYQGQIQRYYSNVAAEAAFNYINSEIFKVYALGGVGGLFLNQKYEPDGGSGTDKNDKGLFLDYQITPIGIKVGKNVGGFAEVGFGYKGIVNIGLFVRL